MNLATIVLASLSLTTSLGVMWAQYGMAAQRRHIARYHNERTPR